MYYRFSSLSALSYFWGLYLGFGSDAENPHLPHNHEENQVVYTGTHDNDTVGYHFFEFPMLSNIEAFIFGFDY